MLDNPRRSLAGLDLIVIASLLAIVALVTWDALINAGGLLDPSGLIWRIVVVLVIWLVGYALMQMAGAWRSLPIAEAAAPLVSALAALVQPLLSGRAALVQRAKGAPRPTERMTADDIKIIVTEGNQERKLDQIEPDEREMIAGIIDMSDRTARDLMVPRLDVIALDKSASLDQALDVGIKYGHSRLPIYEGDIDHIVGILHVKDLIQALRHPSEQIDLSRFARPVHYVPDTAKADNLLRDLLKNGVHMAVVVDEYGGTVGIVTIEDALEEIVGEIRDEYDAAEEPEFTRVTEDEAVFNGRVPIVEVNDALGIQLPTTESDTLGGLVYSTLGHTPRSGEQVTLAGVDLVASVVTGRRIRKVKVISRREPAKSDEAGGTGAESGEHEASS